MSRDWYARFAALLGVSCLLLVVVNLDERLDGLERDHDSIVVIDEGQTRIDSGLIDEVEDWTTAVSVLTERVQELERRAGAVTTTTEAE